MKKLFLTLAGIIIVATMMAQAPNAIKYQALARDNSGDVIANQSVSLTISILQGSITGTEVFTETHDSTTNAYGLVSLNIGAGNPAEFANIDWANGPYFVKVVMDGNVMGTSQLLSVPYAKYADSAGNVFSGSYNDLTDVPTNLDTDVTDDFDGNYSSLNGTPTNVSNFSNDAGYLTQDTTLDESEVDAMVANNGYAMQSGLTDTASDLRTDLATKTALGDSTAKLRSEIPDIPTGTQTGEMQYWDGSAWVTVAKGNEGQVLTFCSGVPTWKTQLQYGEVENPTTGKIWMDRNLGASQVATSSTDANAYGDLYQWGRAADGHESRTSGTTATLATSDTPGHDDFITNGSSPYDWRNPQNDNLWQGVSGTNNPCPSGYRLPTEAEWEAERTSWSSNDAAGAFASPLKLTVTGIRSSSSGSLFDVGSYGYYWSSTVDGSFSLKLSFHNSDADINSNRRATGYSVRCLKD